MRIDEGGWGGLVKRYATCDLGVWVERNGEGVKMKNNMHPQKDRRDENDRRGRVKPGMYHNTAAMECVIIGLVGTRQAARAPQMGPPMDRLTTTATEQSKPRRGRRRRRGRDGAGFGVHTLSAMAPTTLRWRISKQKNEKRRGEG